jgi:hypothetical protein
MLGILLVALLAPAQAAAEEAEAAVVRDIDIRGAEAYTREALLRIIRLRPGDPLHHDAATVAASLETRYHDDGYPAARVSGDYDADTGTLELSVDEGRLAEVVIPGLEGRAEERALRELEVAPGQVLRQADLFRGLDRVEEASEGALRSRGYPGYSLEETPEGSRLNIDLERPLFRLKPRFGRVGIQPVYSRVDGLTPRLGAELLLYDRATYNHTGVYGQAAYGLSSDTFRFTAGARRSFGPAGRITLGYEFHDLTDSDDAFRVRGVAEPPGTTIAFTPYHDYAERRGHEAYVFGRIATNAQVGVSFRDDRYDSVPVTADDSLLGHKAPRPNPEIDEGLMRSLIGTVRWATSGPLFASRGRERDSFLDRSLYGTDFNIEQGVRADADFEVASADVIGGDFTFQRLVADVQTRHELASWLTLSSRALLGLSGGDVPRQKLFALGGIGTLRGYPIKVFPGENIGLLTVEGGLHVPPPILPELLVFYDGGVAWTGDLAGQGWKSDIGVGLRWPRATAFWGRLDFAFPLDDPNDGVQTWLRFHIPF